MSKPILTMEEILAYREEQRAQPFDFDSLQDILENPNYAEGIWMTAEGKTFEFIKGRECVVYLSPRPAHCDRGRYIAQLDAMGDLGRDLNYADLWPRYYFDLERAKAEVEAWMRCRGQLPS